MHDLSARAALVPAPEVSDGLTATVSREEVTEALQASEAPPDLVLDVTRFSNGDPTETRNLVVAWERGDLEELLRQTEGEQLVLTFDREALRQAMEADVEAHGLREKALVLAVAAMAATGAAANASAQVSPDGHSVAKAISAGQAEIPYLSHGTLTPPEAAPSEIPYLSHGTLTPPEAAAPEAAPSEIPYLSHGTLTPPEAAAPEAAPSEIPYLSHGTLTPEEAISAGQAEIPYLSHGTVTPPEAAAPEIPYLSHGILTPEAAAAAAADVASADSGVSISAPDAAVTAGIGAAILFAITGAAFVVGGRRRVTPA